MMLSSMRLFLYVLTLSGGLQFSEAYANFSSIEIWDGVDQESDAVLREKEEYLQSLDLSAAEFKQLSEGNTTKTAWKIKDPISDETVGLLKCTSRNTYAPGGVATYELGKRWDVRLQPVAILKSVTIPSLGLANEVCMVKEWMRYWAQYYWKAQAVSASENTFLSAGSPKRELINALKCEREFTPGEAFQFSAKTRYSHPEVGTGSTRLRGETSLGEAARDFSNLMVLDVVIGNGDRWPGGNINFRSTTRSANIVDSSVELENVRLFSLDNEATFKGSATTPTRDLRSYVSRFDRGFIQKLSDDLVKLKMLGDAADLASDPDWWFLNFSVRGSRQSAVDFVVRNIETVLAEVKEAESRCGDSAYF